MKRLSEGIKKLPSVSDLILNGDATGIFTHDEEKNKK